jgi:hypothetical protein
MIGEARGLGLDAMTTFDGRSPPGCLIGQLATGHLKVLQQFIERLIEHRSSHWVQFVPCEALTNN